MAPKEKKKKDVRVENKLCFIQYMFSCLLFTMISAFFVYFWYRKDEEQQNKTQFKIASAVSLVILLVGAALCVPHYNKETNVYYTNFRLSRSSVLDSLILSLIIQLIVPFWKKSLNLYWAVGVYFIFDVIHRKINETHRNNK